jgi:hypothetical protein
MSLMANALQPFLVRELVSISGRPEFMTLADVINSPNASYVLEFDNVEQSTVLDFREETFIAVALAHDACRLSSASFQTVSGIATDISQRDYTAWSLVKMYYAAFYAGNALLRLFGESCSFFDRVHTSRLAQLAAAMGTIPTFRIDSGLYRCALIRDATALKCTRARSGSGGAHESFWEIFGSKIEMLGEDVLKGSLLRTDAQSVFNQLEGARKILRRKGNYSWLSVVRNELQYRHQFGVWFPTQLKPRERDSLSRLVSAWSTDPMGIELGTGRIGILGEFVSCCSFIVALCHAILERIADLSTAGTKSFVRLGPMVFLNDIRLRERAAVAY